MRPQTSHATVARLDAAAARRVLLLQAFETARGELPQWTADDRAWATRLARSTLTNDATPAQVLDQRARHAMQRLEPRSTAVTRALARRSRLLPWLALAVVLALVVGVAVDAVGSGQRIDLLSPPIAGLLVWNAVVYLGLLLPLRLPRPLRAAAERRVAGRAATSSADAAAAAPVAAFHAAWLRHAAPLLSARAGVVLHTAAAALALGVVGGMYLRGLVLDYRAGWQSTFLDAGQVHAGLSVLLAPASALSGIAVPDAAAVEALRVVGPAGWPRLPLQARQPRQFSRRQWEAWRRVRWRVWREAWWGVRRRVWRGSAAPWIHLFAATVAVFVVLPRSVLALLSALVAIGRSRRISLPLSDPYWQRLLRELHGQGARVQVLAHGMAPTPHALACLQGVLAPAVGADPQLSAGAATAYGDEDAAALQTPPPAGTTLRLALFDLAATPEDDTHGAFVGALRAAAPSLPLLAVVDESGYSARFAAMPARMAERRDAWRRWAAAAELPLVCVDLARPETERAQRELEAALK